eukprot:TRINITY_DN3044_c0_g1_i1.p1 TRINITY_DN3044_c0_g1~~TRINITY_DN3044_c0_g1_i1.p1  ORF type:complete len:1007 (-),score=179.92 TRINITY_DN3044_c0_g1_i1:83-2857(-)
MGSMQILGEVADRTAELDLSLAGVSDNTARHGRAISSLTEQQKRTNQTLDAVVRAVKRLDRSRSRQRVDGTVPATPASSRHTPQTWSAHPAGAYLAGDARDGGVVNGWNGASQDGQGYAELHPDQCAVEGDAWLWPGQPLQRGCSAQNSDRFLRASSSCGSDQRRDVRPRSAAASTGRRTSRRSSGSSGCRHVPVPPFEDGGRVPQSYDLDDPTMMNGCGSSVGEPPATAEVANCVKGVLDRINEALTKIGPGDEDAARLGQYSSAYTENVQTVRDMETSERLSKRRGIGVHAGASVKVQTHCVSGGAMLPEEDLTSEYMGMCLWAWTPKRWSECIAAASSTLPRKREVADSRSHGPAVELPPIDRQLRRRFEARVRRCEAINARERRAINARQRRDRFDVGKLKDWFQAMVKADAEIRSFPSMERSAKQVGGGVGCLFEKRPPASGPRVLPKVPRARTRRAPAAGFGDGDRGRLEAFNKRSSSSVVSVHVGAEGSLAGLASWRQIFSEHDLNEDGRAKGDFYGNSSVHFAESITGRYLPRALVVGYGVDQLGGCRQAGLFAPTSILTGSSQTGMSFREGESDKMLSEEVCECLRQQAEQADFLSGFTITHSAGEDSRTAGLTQQLLWHLAATYGKQVKYSVTCIPASREGDAVAAQARCGLLLSGLIECVDVVNFYDRTALMKLAASKQNGLGLRSPDAAACHSLVARLFSSMTSPDRFGSLVPASEGSHLINFRGIASSVVCYPGTHFVLPGLGGLTSEVSADYRVSPSDDLTRIAATVSALQKGHMCSAFDHATGSKALAVSLLTRGMNACSSHAQVVEMWKDKNFRVVDWIPTCFSLSQHCDPKTSPPQVAALRNDTAAGGIFEGWLNAIEGSNAGNLSSWTGEAATSERIIAAKEELRRLGSDYRSFVQDIRSESEDSR